MTWSEPEVQTVLPGIHRVPVPLPNDGLRAVSVYVVEDGDGVTLIDAGWDSPLAREAVQRGLDVAGAGIGDIRRILVTHVHYDHIGQATALVRAGAGGFWLGKGDEATFRGMTTEPLTSRNMRMRELRRHGAGEIADLALVRRGVDTTRFDFDEPDRWLDDGDVHETDTGPIEALSTPGHTSGHLCFLHDGRRVLFSGDHVLPHITPSIGFEGVVNRMALADFLSSLARVRTLDVDLVLPAHGPVFSDLAGRVDELTAHHDDRLADSLRAIPVGSSGNALTVAQALGWTRRQTSFADLDLFNQVLATWETAAHLELLAARGDLAREETPEAIVFRR